jgi:hypothetical protein
LSGAIAKPASINLRKWFLSPTSIKPWFHTEGNLPLFSSYLPLGVPNWVASTTNQVYIYWSSLHWLLLLVALSLAKKCICFNSHCLPWLLWFHLILLNFLCYFYVGRCDDPICVHFIFKCEIINNALILGELSYICYTQSYAYFNWYWLLLEDKSFLFGT